MMKKPRRSEEAIKKNIQAEKHLQNAADRDRQWDGLGWADRREAERLAKDAQTLLTPLKPVDVVMGEALPQETKGIENIQAWVIADTLSDPNEAHVDASHMRAELLLDAACLPLGLDLSDSVQAKNSIEKCLTHQMAACHYMAMELMIKVKNVPDHQAEQAVPLANAAARLMSCFQQAYLALWKVRSGGKQTVVVQHVHVTDGGQAVVAGSMTPGGREPPGDGREK